MAYKIALQQVITFLIRIYRNSTVIHVMSETILSELVEFG